MKPLSGVQVHIFGHVYTLRGGEDPDRVRRVAEIVDARMNAAADHAASGDSYRVAVLAAIELADELLRERDERARLSALVARRSRELEALIDGVDEPEPAREESLFAAAD